MVITSGTRGHAHAYWTLRTPVTVPEIERANRRLAHYVGGDLACVDAARILRPPGSWNHKHSPPAPVELVELEPTRCHDIGELVQGLKDPRSGRSDATAAPPRAGRNEIDRALLAIPPKQYQPRSGSRYTCRLDPQSGQPLELAPATGASATLGQLPASTGAAGGVAAGGCPAVAGTGIPLRRERSARPPY